MATAAKRVFVEVEEIVDELPPDNIHVPAVYVDKVVLAKNLQKKIEKKVFNLGGSLNLPKDEVKRN
jgi:hypothetical protein